MSNGTFTLFSSLDYFTPHFSSHMPFYSNDILSNVMQTSLTKSDAIYAGWKVTVWLAGRWPKMLLARLMVRGILTVFLLVFLPLLTSVGAMAVLA